MKPTQTLLRRIKLRLTTKGANKGFYKGTGSGAMGEHTKYGGYKLDWEKIRTYVVPEGLKDTKLTPFVTQQMAPTKGSFKGTHPISGDLYLEKWKAENGVN